MKRIVRDLEDTQVATAMAAMRADGLVPERMRQADGRWTVTGVSRDERGDQKEATAPVSPRPQPLPAGDAQEIDTLARTLWAEARGEGHEGMEAVACVIMNRASRRTDRWGVTASAVCMAPQQFSCWNADDPNLAKLKAVGSGDQQFVAALEIARRALAGRIPDPTRGATHYHTRAVAPAWSRGKTPCFELGNHVFFNDID